MITYPNSWSICDEDEHCNDMSWLKNMTTIATYERLNKTVIPACERNIVLEYFVLIDTFPASFIHTK